jgi:hypothetical protein
MTSTSSFCAAFIGIFIIAQPDAHIIARSSTTTSLLTSPFPTANYQDQVKKQDCAARLALQGQPGQQTKD